MPLSNADEVARVWAGSIGETSYTTISGRNLVIRLTRRVNQIVEALDADADDVSAGEEIGRALVSSRFTDAAALTGTLDALYGQLTAYALAHGRLDRLQRLVTALAGGYSVALRERTLAEQEQIHTAALTALAEVEQSRWDSQARFRAVFAEAAIGIAITGLNGQIIDVNQALCDILGYSREELGYLSATDFSHPSDDGEVRTKLSGLLRGDIDHVRVQKVYFRRDRTEIWTDLVVSLVRDQDGNPRFVVGMIEDITDRQRLLTQLRYQATHDPLTTLPNRTVFFDRLTAALADPDPNAHVGVCYLDIDGFKVVNDTLGHDAGDELLRIVADRLANDLTTPTRIVARMGGDEFVILVEIPAPHDLVSIAEQALEVLRAPIHLDGHTLTVSASIGVVDQSVRATTPAELMKAADTTLYWAKADGRDRWAMFDPLRHAQAVSRYRLAAQMPKALDDRQFFLEYQPLVRFDDRAVVGVEALVRWRHPEQGILGPDNFIDLAEHSGLVVGLGRWVLAEACRQAQAWQVAYPDWCPLISVNLSPRQVAEPTIVDEVRQILADTDLPPESLQLELTESALMGTTGKPLSNLFSLADLGVRIAIDDFGTGYSNLAYLNTMPIHALKLAGPFVTALRRPSGPDPADIDMLAALIQLAHTLKFTVTAEEVETAAQAELLATLRCDLAQGWYYSPACAAADVTTSLEAIRMAGPA